MALFEKKKEPAAEAPAEESKSPEDIIREMKSQNYSNNQIVEYLQKQGLKSNEIFDAMNKVETGPAAAPLGAPPAQPSAPMGPPAMPPMPSGISKEQVEEISESIVDERIEDFQKEFKKITDWKDATEAKITELQTKLEDLSKNFETLHTGVLGKIEEYDKGITDVGTEIKALEKVFSKILPTLTENVSELSRITQKLKTKPIKKT
ncbi:hypothetical protein KY345_03045 [Candidatus Woesearchaeota archaeon]|nr:hypothetical protein [Candidatus Woesearchaeota archaeon]